MDDQREDHPDPEKAPQRTSSHNYRPITCLIIMWKRQTLYILGGDLLLTEKTFTVFKKEKGWRKWTGSTEDYYILINTSAARVKQESKNLAMTLIDDKRFTIWFPNEVYYPVSKCLNTWQGHTDYREDHGNLEIGIDSWHIPGSCTITITIWNSDDATQSHSKKKNWRILTQ